MQCPSCSTELLHAANFCPVCGAGLRLDATSGGALESAPPVGDGAYPPTPPYTPDQQPIVQAVPENVVYLQGEPSASQPVPMLPVQQHVTTNVLGETVSVDAVEAYERVMDERHPPREPWPKLGTAIFAAAVLLLILGLVVYGRGLGDGKVANAGVFLLVSMFASIWYLLLPEKQHHRRVMKRYSQLSRSVDARVEPLRRRTGLELQIRRERERYDRMRAERTRRIGELGEIAYREFRAGNVDGNVATAAQKVLAMEQKMLVQDHAIISMENERPVRRKDRPTEPQPPTDSIDTSL